MALAVQPNRRALNVARLIESAAPHITAALQHIALELQNVDGYAGGGSDYGGGSRSTNELTGVEARAERRIRLMKDAEQLRDDLGRLEDITSSMLRICRHAQGVRLVSTEPARCWGGGLDGYNIPIQDGGWSDPSCTNIPDNGETGPCTTCLDRHKRYRRERGLPPLRNEVPAAS